MHSRFSQCATLRSPFVSSKYAINARPSEPNTADKCCPTSPSVSMTTGDGNDVKNGLTPVPSSAQAQSVPSHLAICPASQLRAASTSIGTSGGASGGETTPITSAAHAHSVPFHLTTWSCSHVRRDKTSSVSTTGGGSKISSVEHTQFEPSHFAISPVSHSRPAGAAIPRAESGDVSVVGVSREGGVGSRGRTVASPNGVSGVGTSVGSASIVASGPGESVATGPGVSFPPSHAVNSKRAKRIAPAVT